MGKSIQPTSEEKVCLAAAEANQEIRWELEEADMVEAMDRVQAISYLAKRDGVGPREAYVKWCTIMEIEPKPPRY